MPLNQYEHSSYSDSLESSGKDSSAMLSIHIRIIKRFLLSSLAAIVITAILQLLGNLLKLRIPEEFYTGILVGITIALLLHLEKAPISNIIQGLRRNSSRIILYTLGVILYGIMLCFLAPYDDVSGWQSFIRLLSLIIGIICSTFFAAVIRHYWQQRRASRMA